MKQIAVFMMLALIGISPAMGAEWNFYGSARVQTFAEKRDYGDWPIPAEKSYTQYLQSNSRIGARVSASDSISGRFEYGTGTNVRLLYGKWDFGKGSLLVGQAYSPLNINYSNQVWWNDTGLTGIGGVYSGRNPMVRLEFGGFQIAALKPYTINAGDSLTIEERTPKVEARYRFEGANWDFQVAGSYHTFDVVYDNVTHDIDAWVLATGGSVKAGSFLFAGTFRYGENTEYSLTNAAFDAVVIDLTSNSTLGNGGYGFTLVAGYAVNDNIYLEMGYGYSESDTLDQDYPKDKVYSYYIQSRFTLAPGVMLIPEIGMVDWGNYPLTSLSVGQTTYVGAKWQINF